jgi:hypothetical protein
MKDNRYLNVILTILTIVMALNLAVSWSAAPDLLPAAQAQGIPDEGAQRNEIINQLKMLNKKADEMRQALLSGSLQVKVAMPARDE